MMPSSSASASSVAVDSFSWQEKARRRNNEGGDGATTTAAAAWRVGDSMAAAAAAATMVSMSENAFNQSKCSEERNKFLSRRFQAVRN
jgi:hypothetical protein